MIEHVIDIDLIREASRDPSQEQLDQEGPAYILLRRIYAHMGPALGESIGPFPELIVRVPGEDGYASHRSAITGRYVTEDYAESHPDTTVGES